MNNRRGAAAQIVIRLGIVSVLFLAGALALRAGDEPGIIQGSDQFEFVYRVKLPEIKGEARVWIPLAKTDAFQTVTQEEISIPIKWEKVQDRDYGNDICVIHPQPAGSGKTIELRYRVVRQEKSAYPAGGEDISRYLRPEKLVPANETFKTLAAEATAGKKTDLERAKALYDHVVGRMRYDKSGTGWGRGDAVYACDARTGNCSDFHAYFIALARSVGIPARFAIGATIPADKNEGAIEGYHCWAEFFADGRWLPVDISEAWKNPKLAEYYFGHNPANRFELTKGRDLIVLLSGRDVSWRDTVQTPYVAIVNETFARKMWGDTPAIGQRFIFLDHLREVVGVVEDGKYLDIQESPQPVVYLPLSQNEQAKTVFAVRSYRPVNEMMPAIERALNAVEPNAPVTAQGWWDALADQLFPARAATIALGAMGVLAAMLALTGILGMAAYNVSRRMKEIGIRVALGARARHVIHTAVGRPFVLLGMGSLMGLIWGIFASRLLGQILYQANPRDPIVVAAVVLTMALLGLAASAIPVLRALAVDPSKLLRAE